MKRLRRLRRLRRLCLAALLGLLFASSLGGTFTCRGRAGSVEFQGSSHRR